MPFLSCVWISLESKLIKRLVVAVGNKKNTDEQLDSESKKIC